jgi:hypothetical protein
VVALISEICVVVPARDEQANIERCLHSIEVAIRYLRCVSTRSIEVRVAVVMDRCVDRTADIVRRHGRVEALTTEVGQVGAARAAGTRSLLTMAGRARREVWLANTDADSTVPPNWLSMMIAEADRGIHVVLGTVVPDQQTPSQVRRAWHSRHSVREGHPHIHGANLGIRADAYVSLGGWATVPSGEDVLLAHRARNAGYLHILRTGTIPVTTSGRLVGRAPGGFAAYLRELDGCEDVLAVG